jgi:hypothetical protein
MIGYWQGALLFVGSIALGSFCTASIIHEVVSALSSKREVSFFCVLGNCCGAAIWFVVAVRVFWRW